MDGDATDSANNESDKNLGDLERWWSALGIAIWCFVIIGTIALNVILLLAFLKRPGLRTISNRYFPFNISLISVGHSTRNQTKKYFFSIDKPFIMFKNDQINYFNPLVKFFQI